MKTTAINTPKLSFEKACAQYVHRFTMEHVPQWAREQREDGTYYAPQFRSDREWYENTIFPPHNEHSATDCHSSGHTWPLGQALPEPYYIGYLHPKFPEREPGEWFYKGNDIRVADEKDTRFSNLICQVSPGVDDKTKALLLAAPALLEALIKAERLITMMLTEVYREEIQRYLSGGFKEFVENASLKDSLGVSAAIKKAQP